MNANPYYYVSMQSNFYDDGRYSVEIARALDFSGPGALASDLAGNGSEHDDPREAVAAAIELAKFWRAEIGRKRDSGLPFRCFTIAGNAYCYPTVEDAMTAPELLKWAETEWKSIPKCDHCGTHGRDWETVYAPDDRLCSQQCCEAVEESICQFERDNVTHSELVDFALELGATREYVVNADLNTLRDDYLDLWSDSLTAWS